MNVPIQKRPRFRRLFDINKSIDETIWGNDDGAEQSSSDEDAIPIKKMKYSVIIPEGLKTPKVPNRRGRKTKKTPEKVNSDGEKELPDKVTIAQKPNMINDVTKPIPSNLNIEKSPVKPLKKRTVTTPLNKSKKITSPDETKRKKCSPKVLKTPKNVSKKNTTVVKKNENPTNSTNVNPQQKSDGVVLFKNLQMKLAEEINERRSTLEFEQKSKGNEQILTLTQKKRVRIPGITCTRLHRSEVHVFEQIVRKIGGFMIDDEVTERTTHLVVGQCSRTVNLLRAVARGCWVLKHEWVNCIFKIIYFCFTYFYFSCSNLSTLESGLMKKIMNSRNFHQQFK